MNFDHYLQQAINQDELAVAADWGQGRTTFGGLSAALALAHIAPQAGDKTLRSVNVSFCGPLQTGTPFRLLARNLRSGKSVTHLQGEVWQGEGLCTQINACFGSERESGIEVTHQLLLTGEAGGGQRMPYIKGLTPEFTRHIDFSYVEGGLPFSGSKANHIKGWMRFNAGDEQQAMTNAHLLALIDAWPPTLLQKLKAFAPCASVTWSAEMVTPLAQLPAMSSTDWLWYEAEIRQAHHGYGHTEARIATADGTLLALSRQLVVVYDR